ncbi:MAG: divalent metal cation transporter, partial [Thermoanaerobacteraceae bacterium]|nr:divalent metal cation transporter [Thermoanaerobacteraceae bacterium]
PFSCISRISGQVRYSRPPSFFPTRAVIWTQILNGILLPVVLISMIRMVNNRDIMGEYTNSVLSNIIGWMTIIISSYTIQKGENHPGNVCHRMDRSMLTPGNRVMARV